ncbi:hypothetical protein NP233_g2621 [Leucocoprinus birnbaumii]|uniref:Methyltransferase domain-containing protein n=1 Tax=Leucocoprinus birnbaumii TaxID=56174 RepID=A0AAD5W119_9AGAR|nr:hypothetical protein NP233_g2621 [Leucocoprinus birnbaumii]
MASPSIPADQIPPLDPGLLNLNQDEFTFFKALTGIKDDDEVKKHIIDVQEKAYQVFPYPCIRVFNFTRLKISGLPAYAHLIRLKDEHSNAVLLDAGCCFGNDLRKAVLDGWPVENVIGVDIEDAFWKSGHELFKSTPETFPAGFIAGDIFKDEVIAPSDPFYKEPTSNRPVHLNDLQSLIPLQGHVSAIHASSLFHLFDEDKQAILAKRLASLLSPYPGSVIFGSHGGLPEKKRLEFPKFNAWMFCHDPGSWKALWEGIFKPGTIRVDVTLQPIDKSGVHIFKKEDTKTYLLVCFPTARASQMASADAVMYPERPHDATLLELDERETEFFKALTGIENTEELKQHITDIQRRAYRVYRYPCIAIFAFTSLRTARLPGYRRALQIPRQRPDAIFLDLACCFGNILRKAVADGWPVENAVGSDLHEGLWEFGHDLFKSSPETFPAGFVPGDAFSSAVIEPREPFYSPPQTTRPADLRSLKSLTPLQGHVSAIHASCFFHLFNEDQQHTLAKQVATLLSPEPGSVIFGVHGGKDQKGFITEVTNSRGEHMFGHSPESWVELWENQVFKTGSVKVEAELVQQTRTFSHSVGLANCSDFISVPPPSV